MRALEGLSTETLMWWLPIVEDNGWTVNSLKEVRDKKGRCPLCALADEVLGRESGFQTSYWSSMREASGESMDINDGGEIAGAADGVEWRKYLRKDLLQILGVEE
jgi:hypothetical protein